MHRVLFVCTGNTCRSPMAAALFNKLARERGVTDVRAESAGTMAIEGIRATPQAIAVARKYGVDIRRHRARAVTKERAERAALILTMTGRQWYDVTEFVPREKVYVLSQFGRSKGEGEDIPDPLGGSQEIYEEVFARLKQEIERSFPAIVEWVRAHGGGRR